MSPTPSALDVATVTMISLVGSLADNKSALGRRYGEWAVSAPTIESAVAAAAMAQDELGHARSIYDEQPWIHMIIVPRSAIREAIRA